MTPPARFCGDRSMPDKDPDAEDSTAVESDQGRPSTIDYLFEDIRRVEEIVERTPRTTDMDEHGKSHSNTVYRYFDSWQDFLAAAGLETYDPHPSGDDHPQWNGVEVECDWCGETKLMSTPRAERSTHHFCSPEDGRTYSECRERWWAENRVGENHPEWNPDSRAITYGSGWNDRKRERVRERDGRRCQNCGRTEEEHLDLYGQKHAVHHIQKARSFDDPERRNRMENLVTLCTTYECHNRWEEMSPLRPQVDLPSDDD